MKTTRLERRRGDTYSIPVIVKISKAAIDITGYTFKMSVSSTADPADVVFTSTGVIDSASAGTAHFPITAENADRVGTLYFDMQVTDAGGYLHTPIVGEIKFTQDLSL